MCATGPASALLTRLPQRTQHWQSQRHTEFHLPCPSLTKPSRNPESNNANLRLQVRELRTSVGRVSVNHRQTKTQMPGMRQAEGEANDRPRSRHHFQRLRLLRNRLPQLVLQQGRRRRQESQRIVEQVRFKQQVERQIIKVRQRLQQQEIVRLKAADHVSRKIPLNAMTVAAIPEVSKDILLWAARNPRIAAG